MRRARLKLRPRPHSQQPAISILDAMDDEHLFGQHFTDADSWKGWCTFLAVLFGLPLDDEQQLLFRQCTGRSEPHDGYNEAWLVIGRRGGKSFILALIAVYLATFKDWRPYLGPGERGTVMVIAADRAQARVIMRYCKGLLTSVPMLQRLVTSETQSAVHLRNRVTIETHTASFRSTRGYSIIAGLLDELAFWSTSEDSAEPDIEVINAIKPGMANVPGSMLLCASSPYAKRGALWNAYKKHFGKDDSSVLVWQAPTRVMNPSIPQSYIDAEIERDPAANTAEYLASFRTDIESYIGRAAVEACVGGNLEYAPVIDVHYAAFVDPSGGQVDSMTLAIGHRIDNTTIIDCLREVKAPFSPDSVVGEFSELLQCYNISKLTGDRYAGLWPVEAFRKNNITYEQAAKPKSDLYQAFLAAVNSRLVELPAHDRLVNQLCSLERRTSRGGRDSIDHPPGQHDDLANACAGLVATFTLNASSYRDNLDWVGSPSDEDHGSYWSRYAMAMQNVGWWAR
jgi:hypothetical protein